MKEEVNTPFGKIEIKVNNKKVSYHSILKESSFGNIYLIDIDTENMQVGDTVFCGVSNPIFNYYGGEERSEILMAESEELLFSFCGYEPQYHESERKLHSFYLKKYTSRGFIYQIETDPEIFGGKPYQTRIITLALSYFKKEHVNDMIKLLTREIKYDFSLFQGTVQDAEKIIKKYSHKGEKIDLYKEKIVCSKIIGQYIGIDGSHIDTNTAIIHYSKKGNFIIPTKPIFSNDKSKNFFVIVTVLCSIFYFLLGILMFKNSIDFFVI